MSNSGLRRVAPAIGLYFVAPLVAEYLLGDLPIKMLGVLAILAPFYGGGALLIREAVRRTGRGWPSIFVLAFAYAVFEEAFTTQTLFNPNYLNLNLHLLQPAYIPALGIGIWWTVFVLTLHTVWSISASIASTAHQIKTSHFMASTVQLCVSAVVCVAAIVAAFLLPARSAPRKPGSVPSPWLIGAAALVAGSIFMTVPPTWAWGAVAIYLLLDLMMIAAISALSHRERWNGLHRLALAGGAALAYAWHAFIQNPAVGDAGPSTRIGNVIFAAGLIGMLVVAARHTASYVNSARTSTAVS